MKQFKWIALSLAVALCLTACGPTNHPGETPDPAPVPEIIASPDPQSGIPDATTSKEPTQDGETYQANGMYLGMADNNLLVIIEANPEDGKPEKSYQISPEIDLAAMGIEEGNMVNIEYTVDENGIKRVKTISAIH